MSTTNKLDEFFSKKDSKKKKVGSSNKTSKTDDKMKKETISRKQAEESDEVNLDVTPSSSSLAGLEKLSFLSISSSSIGSWAEEEEKQDGQPILHTKGRSLSNLKKEATSQEEQSKDLPKEDKFTGWKIADSKSSEATEIKGFEDSSSLTTKPAEEKFPTLEETAKLPKVDKSREVTNSSSKFATEENKSYASSRPGSKVAGSLRALLLESQQDKLLKQETTSSAEKKQEQTTPRRSEVNSGVTTMRDRNSSNTVGSSEPVKETSQRRRKFSGLQAIIEEASKDKQTPKATNGFTNSPVSKEKSSSSSLGAMSRGSSVDQQSKTVDSKSKQRVSNMQSNFSEERNDGSSIDARRNRNRYSALSDSLKDDAE
ncbi:hypothetical protein Gasu2_25520 [Galdieria sulphuraria]|uniref:Nucleic acid binding protein n=1 Tax=Galdieria sulphuraria TaxID=130081 RepID=M2Y4N2_GALSU|nr:nucleic acid binding protein [Galdieria sulphuraria]EME30809.1 nucleic acid binding protein [Galdieria sulphuraria]GJD08248.1 hypothetical protein Gasu2_25520 [Galdieria sulphuraria]|eukprot:XP_005707329.1 nucleic acid binding protein [Galdieria sulphuraria]